jgi:hypothetical protein
MILCHPTSLSRLAFAALLLGTASARAADATPSPANAEVYFISPLTGAHVDGKFTVRFGLKGMGIAPAGVQFPDSGHHHLLINAEPMPDLTQPLPMNDQIRHFGKGQTETELELPPGTYTLQLVLGDHLHQPHKPPVLSGTITVTVDP